MQQKFLKFTILAIIAITILSNDCAKLEFKETEKIVSLNIPFQLKINQTAAIKNENIKIKFLKITEDSRCPLNVQCIWVGQVTAIIEVFKNNQNLGQFNLTKQAGSDENLAIKNFDVYSIKLINVQPYPQAGQKIDVSNYTITLFVSKI